MRTSPYTAMAAAPGTDFSGLANLMAMKGRGGDNTLVHMSKSELPYLNSLARSAGHPQGLPVNPKTGLPEANILKSILPIAGTILGGMFAPQFLPAILGKGALAAGVGAGLGSFGGSLLAGKSFKDAAIGGLISGGLSGLSAGMFGGAEGTAGANPGTVGTAGGDIVGPSLNAMPGGGSSIVEGAQLGAFGMPEAAGMAGDLSAGASGFSGFNPPLSVPQGTIPEIRELGKLVNLNLAPNAHQLTITGGATGLGSAGDMIAGAQSAVPTGISSVANTVPAAIPNAQYIKALQAKDLVGKDFGVSDLAEGFKPDQSSLDLVQGMDKPAYLSRIQQYNPKLGLDRMDFLKTQFKPAATQAGVMLGIDALTEQGAFEPIDYSGYPTGEENKVSPLPLRGLKFESERTGAFPTTTAQALAFAQPGGAPRQRFFNQRFTIPARTGGGIAALIR